MPPRNVLQGLIGLVRVAFLWGSAWGLSPLAAQELPLLRDAPGLGPFECPAPGAPVHPAPDEQMQAGQLASDAVQAVILGELLRAEELLARAVELDPTSAELAYRYARVLEDLTRSDVAMTQYCRAIVLGAQDVGITDAQARIDAIYEVVRSRIPEVAREAFLSGLTTADAAMYEQSVTAFTTAVDAAPEWPEPVYNRAVVLERLERFAESLADYRRYLELTPSELDPIVSAVAERVGMLEGLVAVPTPSPGGALALGAVFPGMGQYYSGRSIGGTVVLSLAAGAVAAGVLFKEVTIRCLSPTPDGDCPAGQAVGESTRRPYLVPALGAAGAVTLIGAIEAFVRARGRRADVDDALAPVEARVAPRLVGPSVGVRNGRVELSLLALRFR